MRDMADRQGLVPYQSLNVESLPASARVAAWQEFGHMLHKIEPILADGEPLRAQAHTWVVDDVVFGCQNTPAQAMARRKGKEISDDRRNFLFGVRFFSGSSHFVHDGIAVDIRPGAFYLMDHSRESRSLATGGRTQGVAIPHERVGYDPEKFPARFIFGLETTPGRLLADTMAAIIERAPNMRLEDAPPVADFFCGAVARLIHTRIEDAGPGEQPAEEKVRRFVIEHLHSPELSVAGICRQFGVSRATLYRYFQADGGFQKFIETRRMDNALRSLAFGPVGRGRVGEVAHSVGYTSVKRFSRVFKRVFGLSPSDVVGAFPDVSGGVKVEGNSNRLWEGWMVR